MSILSVDNISPIGSGTSVTVNSAATLVLTNANSTGVVTATTFVGNLTGNVTGTASANAVLTGSTNNTLVTVTGANAITGESNLTFTGKTLTTQTTSYPETTELTTEFKAGVANGNRYLNRYIKLTNTYTGSAHGGIPIVWEANADGSNNKSYGSIGMFSDGAITFYSRGAGAAVNVGSSLGMTEKLRIGNDGILVTYGTGAVNAEFNTSNSSGAYFKFDLSASGATTGYMGAGGQLVTGSATADLGIRSQANMVFSTGGSTERLRIDSSGRVVVGGTSAYIGGAALAVLGTGTTPNTYGSFAIGKVGANPTSGTTLANIRLNGGSVGTRRGAEINAVTAGNWTDGSSHPTSLIFAVAKDGSASVSDRVIINHYGHFQVTNENALPSGSPVGGTNGFKGLSQHGYQHWGQRQYYSGQRNLTQNGYFDLFSNNIAHDDIIFWLNIKGYHSNRTFATAHGTMGGYGLSVSYQSASGVYGAFSLVDVATGRRKLRWTSTSPNSANWWIWGWFSGTAYTSTLTGWAAGQLH